MDNSILAVSAAMGYYYASGAAPTGNVAYGFNFGIPGVVVADAYVDRFIGRSLRCLSTV